MDPHFAELTRGIVIMGGSLNPHTEDPEFATSPRHEFNWWFAPGIITQVRDLYMSVDVSHGPAYGETLTWSADLKPAIDVQLAHAQVDLDLAKLTRMFVDLMKAPGPRSAGMVRE
ncbi:MAG: hypothetical protein ACHQIL_09150 [Steroidobacterales bacterium]